MPAHLINIIIGGLITFFGSFILFGLGLIVSYVRSMNKSMKEVLTMTIRHETKLESHEKQLDNIFNRVQKLETA